jgi:hypothetical protein
MKLCSRATMSLVLLGMSTLSVAEEDPARGGLLARVDMEFGGDDLVTVDFEDGESQDIKAGQGLGLGIGGWFRPVADNPFEVHALVGFKYTTTAAENADINVSRMVLRLDGVYRFANEWWASIGLTHHASPELDGDGFFEDIPFDDATGFSAGFGWKWIGLHYTSLEYSSAFYEDVDAGSIGLSLTYRFGAN